MREPSPAFHIHAVKSSDPARITLPLGCQFTHSSPPPDRAWQTLFFTSKNAMRINKRGYNPWKMPWRGGGKYLPGPTSGALQRALQRPVGGAPNHRAPVEPACGEQAPVMVERHVGNRIRVPPQRHAGHGRPIIGPDRYCSPHHRMLFHSRECIEVFVPSEGRVASTRLGSVTRQSKGPLIVQHRVILTSYRPKPRRRHAPF